MAVHFEHQPRGFRSLPAFSPQLHQITKFASRIAAEQRESLALQAGKLRTSWPRLQSILYRRLPLYNPPGGSDVQ